MAEIGVILLMFGVGLQFHFEELLKVRRVALLGAAGEQIDRERDRIRKELFRGESAANTVANKTAAGPE